MFSNISDIEIIYMEKMLIRRSIKSLFIHVNKLKIIINHKL